MSANTVNAVQQEEISRLRNDPAHKTSNPVVGAVREEEEEEMKHSPLPFYVGTRPEVDVDEVIQTGARSFSYTGGYTGNDEYDREWGVFCIIDNEPEVLAQPWNQADAEFIVRACNCHERLVDACQYLLNCFHWRLGSDWNKNEAVELAQSAINAAREK